MNGTPSTTVEESGGDQFPFRYDGYEVDPSDNRLVCHYSLGRRRFVEQFTFDPGGTWDQPAVEPVARLLFLLTGVSYYKTAAPSVIDLNSTEVTVDEAEMLRNFYTKGLAELAYKNGIDLSGLRIEGRVVPHRPPVTFSPEPASPLIPFGGGIDSIVTVDAVRATGKRASLFVVSLRGDRFAAIERAAAVTGLPILRANRSLDPQVLRSEEMGFLRGHVPVTGIISAAAALAAVLNGHDAVVMSNEWSASVGNLVVDGQSVNHQYSKGREFETEFRRVLAGSLGSSLQYFSLLRPHTELWVAARFARLGQYHSVFHSCNRAFRVERDRRFEDWCGECDKCCFIDLILAPFIGASELDAIFNGREPLGRSDLAPRFRSLLATAPQPKPFECVGDVAECRAALRLAVARPDRAGNKLLRALADEVPVQSPDEIRRLFEPMGEHCVPDEYSTEDLLV